MSTQGHPRACVVLSVLILVLIPFGIGAIESDHFFERGVTLYEQGQFRQAASLFRRAVETDPASRNYHWLGKSYGHLAEQADVFEAFHLARRTRLALEKAVETDAGNREAIEDLIEFYTQAPVIAGGNPEKAEKLKRHLANLDSNKESGSPVLDNACDDP